LDENGSSQNKVHIFDLTTETYSEADVSGTKPPPMNSHTATIVNEKGAMLVFGGDRNYYGNVYSLDLNSMNWSSIDNVQYVRGGHSADLIGNSIYLFGGSYDGSKSYIQLHKVIFG
jgi:N-acetylneuraminic acid mutarotase